MFTGFVFQALGLLGTRRRVDLSVPDSVISSSVALPVQVVLYIHPVARSRSLAMTHGYVM